MPWNAKDATSHTGKADDPKLKRMWSHVANKVLQETGDDGEAVREANGVVAKQQAKKSVFEDLMDLAKSDVLAKTTMGPRKQPHFGSAGFNKTRFRKPGFRRAQMRRMRNVGRMTSTGKRNYH